MQLFKKNIFGFVLILVFLGLAGVAVAQIAVEGNYPDVVNISITKASPLGEIVKYFVGWALIVAGVVALLSLIAAGFLYLTAAGDPGQATTARTRITNSAIGVVILFSSFIVFKVIDPKINIVNIETKPVASGVFLFKAGSDYQDFLDGKISIGTMVKLNEAYYIANDIPDMNKVFGDFLWDGSLNNNKIAYNLIKADEKLDFKSFPLGGIGFWGDYGKRTKVVLYDQSDYNSSDRSAPKEYSYDSATKTVGDIKVINLTETNYAGFFNTPPSPNKTIKCFGGNNVEISDCTGEGAPNKLVNHPPLSIALHGNGPGIYLYSAKNDKIEQGPDKEKYFISSISDFDASDVKFNDEARFIALKNKFDTEAADSHDYLAILHENSNYTGQLKIFFELSNPRKQWVRDTGSCSNGDNKDSECTGNVEPAKQQAGKDYESFKEVVKLLDTPAPILATNGYWMKNPQPFNLFNKVAKAQGNFRANPADDYKADNNKETPWYTMYGKVEKPSSLQVFELSNDETACKRVRICTEKNFLGVCSEFTYDNQHVASYYNIQQAWLPLYKPENLLDSIGVKFEDKNKDVKIAKNIRSIEIEGDCVVVLFENSLLRESSKTTERKKALMGYLNRAAIPAAVGTLVGGEAVGLAAAAGTVFVSYSIDNWKKALGDPSSNIDPLVFKWENGSPGEQSEVFTESDSDLTDNQIGRCGILNRIGFKQGSPCASAIAIYPIQASK
jgi:hypothetical protein